MISNDFLPPCGDDNSLQDRKKQNREPQNLEMQLKLQEQGPRSCLAKPVQQRISFVFSARDVTKFLEQEGDNT